MSRRALLGFCLSVGLAASGCTQAADDTVTAKVELIDQVKSAMSISRVQNFESIEGYYGYGCQDRFSHPWSLAVNPNGQLMHPALSVVKNDTDCTLTITGIVVSGQVNEATPEIPLASSYATSATGFRLYGMTQFYANALITTTTFADDFTIKLVVSEEPQSQWIPKHGTYTAQSSSVEASGVPTPGYTIDMTPFVLQSDASGMITNVGGYAQLMQGFTAAQTYAIAGENLAMMMPSAETLAVAWDAATVKGNVADLELSRIPAADFGLVGHQLHQGRTVMLRNTVEGVSSYQLFGIDFFWPIAH